MALFLPFVRVSRFVIYFSVLLLSVQTIAAPPRWLTRLPRPSNETFYYLKESATATNDAVAYNKAMGLVIQQSIMSLGLPYTSKQIEAAISTGTLESTMAEWKIPVRHVCTYRQGLESGAVRVYVLCQVATAGNIDVQFDDFRHCGNDGDKFAGQMNLRPEAWAMYEMDTYFANFAEFDINEEMGDLEAKTKIEDYVIQSLIKEVALKDSSLIRLIKTEYHQYKKHAYAVAYIERQWVIEKYEDDIKDGIDICFNLLENAVSYIEEGNAGEGKALIYRANEQLEELQPFIRFLNAYSSSRTVDRYIEETNELHVQISDLLVKTAGNTHRARESKIYEFINTGQYMLGKQMVGDALRYFYAAQILLADIENNQHINIKNDDGQEVHANIYLQTQLTQILKNIQVTSDGYFPDSQTEMKLSFRYKGVPITTLNYAYNANLGWSDVHSVNNGWSAIILPENNKPNTLHIRIEYDYADEATFDAELPALMEKHASRFSYDNAAKTIIPLVHAPIRIGLSSNALAQKHTTDITQNYVVNKIEEDQHKVNEIDEQQYHQIILTVCDAIKSKKYSSVFPMFTMEGYEQFQDLIEYGQARVITLENCRYIRVGTDVQCRSIPMSFTFSKGKQQLENVVFTFNQNGKIDGLQFALEERSARNVMGDTDIDELSRLMLINFLENYKTAFALKRLDYIESIFSDDAVIITGRVLQKTEQSPEFKNLQIAMDSQIIHNNILYSRMSKTQYIKRLKNSFESKEWINIKFGGTVIERSMQANTYGMRLVQDYTSNNYGDHGYLFLLVDTSDKENPTILVRSWQPETGGVQPFSIDDFDMITNGLL